jgi:DNA-binding NarL/FixJ family response regulator
MVRVMIVDDHAVVRQGLRMFLALDPELEVVGDADNGAAGIELARQLRPDVVLMDILMPGMDGVTAMSTIRQELPDTEVVALTSSMDPQTIVGAVRAGAIGYLRKDMAADDLCRAVRAAADGQVQLAPEAAARLMQEMRGQEAPVAALSDRELQILGLLVEGKTNKEIATALQIGEKTVKTHMSNIMPKLGAQSRTQAALAAVRLGIVPPRSTAAAR